MTLPPGPLVAWPGDDFTGGAAVAETLSFAGLPAALFLKPPAPAMLARFPGLRGIGVATTARAESPAWMDEHLPALYAALLATGALLIQYKACSTMDSAPHMGSGGRWSWGSRLRPRPARPSSSRRPSWGGTRPSGSSSPRGRTASTASTVTPGCRATRWRRWTRPTSRATSAATPAWPSPR